MNGQIKFIGDFYVAEKTSDIYREVELQYDGYLWRGTLPKKLRYQGLDLTESDFQEFAIKWYDELNPNNRKTWIGNTIQSIPKSKFNNQTYLVLQALFSGEWECRVCGPVPQINPQAASRLRDLKKQGFIISSKRRLCTNCGGSRMHDILIMISKIESKLDDGNEYRKPISKKVAEHIVNSLGRIDVFFHVNRLPVEFVIDHKFPSQRWSSAESDNTLAMTKQQIENKFQLLTNQSNMLKSRFCDRCVATGLRGNFMGISYFYEGDEHWRGKSKSDENGCIGCPWYDLKAWKESVQRKLNE